MHLRRPVGSNQDPLVCMGFGKYSPNAVFNELKPHMDSIPSIIVRF